jgi:cytoskeleton protein RodZ
MAASAAEAVAAQSPLHVQTSAASWIEITDSRGLSLVSRIVQPGESLWLDGALPMKIKVGNAGATQIAFRGKDVDLAPVTRDNVARLEIK